MNQNEVGLYGWNGYAGNSLANPYNVPQDTNLLSTGNIAQTNLNKQPGTLEQLGGLGAIAELIGSIGGLVQGFKANKLAKQSLNFQKDAFNKNFNNQVKSYNTNLADTINARYSFEGKTQDQANQYINANKL